MRTFLLIGAVVLASAGTSMAATFTGSSQSEWTSVDASFGYATSSTSDASTVTWGVEWESSVAETDEAIAAHVAATDPNSNHLTFFNNPNWTSSGGMFSLGGFEYHNGTSYVTSHDFNGADLSINVALTDPFVGELLTFAYSFEVLTTTNHGVSVPEDADTLLVMQTPPTLQFNANGEDYLFELLGLSTNGGSTFSSEFVVFEPWQQGVHHDIDPTRTEIYARITPAPVPVPASILFLASAIGGFGFMSRRRSRQV